MPSVPTEGTTVPLAVLKGQAENCFSGGFKLSGDGLVGALWGAHKCPAQREEVQRH